MFSQKRKKQFLNKVCCIVLLLCICFMIWNCTDNSTNYTNPTTPANEDQTDDQRYQIAFINDKNRVGAFGQWELYIINQAHAETRLTEDGYITQGPSWSPDGQQIVYTANPGEDWDLFIMDLANDNFISRITTLRLNVTPQKYNMCPTWSNDGNSIVFNFPQNFGRIGGIYLINTDGSNLRNVTNDTLNNYSPTWSPDDTQIAFVSDRSGNEEIYVINTDGSELQQITTIGAFEPDWSSAVNKMVFCTNQDGNQEIYTMNPDGSDLLRLTNNTCMDKEPAWSPSGTHIVFVSDRDGNLELYMMNADGTGISRITNDEYRDWDPAWRPN